MFAELIKVDGYNHKVGDPAWLTLRHFASSLRALRYRF